MVLITMSLIFSQIRVVLTPFEPRYCHKAFRALKTHTRIQTHILLGVEQHMCSDAIHIIVAKMCRRFELTHKPFVSLAGLVIAVRLVFRVLLVDAVVGQMHELVTQSLHGRRIPKEEKHKCGSKSNMTSVISFLQVSDILFKV